MVVKNLAENLTFPFGVSAKERASRALSENPKENQSSKSGRASEWERVTV